MRTKCYNVYKFSELSKETQAKAIDKLRDINIHDKWFEPVIDDWKIKLEEKGFLDVDIEFTGFYSQGDGASFTAKVDLQTYIGRFSEFRLIRDMEKAGWVNFSIDRISSHYSHKYTVRAAWESRWGKSYPLIEKRCLAFLSQLEEEKNKLCTEIYKELEEACEYLQSDEAIKETIKANDYEFNDKGEIDL